VNEGLTRQVALSLASLRLFIGPPGTAAFQCRSRRQQHVNKGKAQVTENLPSFFGVLIRASVTEAECCPARSP
jgi:hypothetical protein